MDKHDSKKKVIDVGTGSYYLAHQEPIKENLEPSMRAQCNVGTIGVDTQCPTPPSPNL